MLQTAITVVLGKKETVLHSWTSQDIKTKHMANILRRTGKSV